MIEYQVSLIGNFVHLIGSDGFNCQLSHITKGVDYSPLLERLNTSPVSHNAKFVLRDTNPFHADSIVSFESKNSQIFLTIEAHSDYFSDQDAPVASLQKENDEITLRVWSDSSLEDPTHVISFNKARSDD